MTTILGIASVFGGLKYKGGPEYSHPPKSFYARFGKRTLDVSAIVLCAPVAIPCLAALLVGTRIYGGRAFAVETRIGRNGDGFRIFRAPMIDRRRWGGISDLPLLLNVLKGDLSLVGPPPMTHCEAKAHRGISYYHLRPGLIDPSLKPVGFVRSPSTQAGKNAEYLVSQSLFGDLLAIWKRCLQ